VLVTSAHLVIERLTIVTYLQTPTRGLFTLLLDQTLHMLSIALIVWVAGGWTLDTQAITFGIHLPVAQVAAAAGLLAVTSFGSILAFETDNSLLRGDSAKGRVLRFDLPRCAGMLERGTAFILALVWSPAGALLVFAPRLVWGATRHHDHRARPILQAITGAALCALAYIAVAVITYLTTTGANSLAWLVSW
jgi:hypothetical protein